MTKTEKEQHQQRKDEHFSLAIKYWRDLQRAKSDKLNFDDLRLIPHNLPEIAVKEVDLRQQVLGRTFERPFYIEAMTGGTARTDALNAQLAQIAANQHLAMAVGSQSIALRFPDLAAGFQRLRQLNPQGFIWANLGAGHDLEAAKRAVEMLAADALEIHINTAQELTMSEGDRSFYWLDNIAEIASKLERPVIVKEVGFGMSQRTFRQLAQTEVAAINVGGAGGTNFAWIERQRGRHGLNLDDFGFSTVESLLEAKLAQNTKTLIATGGIRSVMDIAKSLMLGADLASSAGFILSNLTEGGPEQVEALIEQWQADLRKICALLGLSNLTELRQVDLLYSPAVQNFLAQREQIVL